MRNAVKQLNAGIGCSRISGIWSERRCARADMECAHGEPHVLSDRESINKVIGLFRDGPTVVAMMGGVSLRKPRKVLVLG